MNASKRPRVKTGLVLPAMFGALTPARALTSYMRRRYHRRYASRYHRPAPLFIFDMVLAGIAVALIAWDVFLAMTPLPEADRLALSFRTGTVNTLAPVAMEAVIESHESHENVGLKLRWMLPADAEVLSAQPAFDANREMVMPPLPAGKTVMARVVVRLHSPVGERVNIGFRLRDEKGWMVGTGERTIAGSGVELGTTSQFMEATPSSSWHVGWIKNTTALSIEHLSIAGEKDVTLAPFQTRTFEYRENDLQANDQGKRLTLFIQNKSVQQISVSEGHGSTETTNTDLTLDPWSPGEPLRLHLSTAFIKNGLQRIREMDSRDPWAKEYAPGYDSGEIYIVHEGVKDQNEFIKTPIYLARLPYPDLSRRDITLPPDLFSDAHAWYAWIVWDCNEGNCSTSPIMRGAVTTSFVPSVSVNYYLSSGDQVGIGPFPPRKGETTRLWVEWSLAPITKTLNAIQLQSVLPRDVKFTGRVSLPDGGTLTESEGSLTWNLGTHEATANPLRARFEVEIQPATDTPVTYQNSVHASAYDAEARISLTTSTREVR